MFPFVWRTRDSCSHLGYVVITDQEDAAKILGAESNGLLWPHGSPDDEDELDERESYNNQRLMRIGLRISSSPTN